MYNILRILSWFFLNRVLVDVEEDEDEDLKLALAASMRDSDIPGQSRNVKENKDDDVLKVLNLGKEERKQMIVEQFNIENGIAKR